MEILIGLTLALLAGLVPMLVYALVIRWFDRYEAEPVPLLIAVFLWGAVPSIILALIIEVVFDVPIRAWLAHESLMYQLVGGSVIAPLVEELLKGAAVLGILVFFYREFDSLLDGIIYGSLVGLGFAAVENTLYFLGALLEGGLGSLLMLIGVRAFLFGFNHAFFTSLTGIGLALARLSRAWTVRLGAPCTGLFLAITAHAIHNSGMTLASASCLWPLLSLASDWIGLLVIFGVIVLATFQEQRWLKTYLPDEVEAGVLTEPECQTVCSYRGRVAQRAAAFFSGDFGRWRQLGKFYQTATELAFRKHQLAALGEAGRNQAAIERLRQALQVMPR